MSVLIVVNTAPYGSEGPYNAFRLAEALALRDEHVEVFLMGDAVHAARAGQDPAAPTPRLNRCCSASSRGAWTSRAAAPAARPAALRRASRPGVRIETIHDLAAATARSDKVVSF